MQRNRKSSVAACAVLALLVSLASIVVTVVTTVVERRQVAALGAQPDYVSPAAVRAALLQDPAMLLDAGRKLRADAMADRAKADLSLVDAARDELARPTPGQLGNPSGKHLVVEFFDYQCGHCRDAELHLREAVRHDPEMRIVQRDIPILGPGSVIAARAALAAARQGLYGKMHDALMTAPVPVGDGNVEAAARGIGADLDRLRKDMASKEVSDELEANVSLSRRVGVSGTPAFAVPGRGLLEGFTTAPDLVAFVTGTSHS